MKSISILTLLAFLILTGCSNLDTKKDKNDLVAGGLYLLENEDGSFGVSKILVLEKFAVHIRMYSDKFETKPNDLNSSNLTFLIGHFPIAREGFLMDKPELLKIEKVTEKELEGYNYYLEAMKNQ